MLKTIMSHIEQEALKDLMRFHKYVYKADDMETHQSRKAKVLIEHTIQAWCDTLNIMKARHISQLGGHACGLIKKRMRGKAPLSTLLYHI